MNPATREFVLLTWLLRKHLRPHRGVIAGVLGLQLVQIVATLMLPSLNAGLVDQGIVAGDTRYIMVAGVTMVVLVLVQFAADAAVVWLCAWVATEVGRQVRSEVIRSVQDLSSADVSRFGVPSLITRTVNDVQQVQTLVTAALTTMVSAPIMCVGAIILALVQDVPLALLVTALVVVTGTAVAAMLARMNPVYRTMQERLDRLNLLMRERIGGVRVVRAFVRDEHESARFREANRDLLALSLRVNRLVATMFPVVLFVVNGFSAAAVWVGAYRVDSGEIGIGVLTAILSYLGLTLMSIIIMTFVLLALPRAQVAAERISEVLRAQPTIHAPADPIRVRVNPGTVVLRGVGFRYPGAQESVLSDVNVVVEPGRTVAVVGSTGSGKTTLVNLMLRLCDATEGSVLVDGVDVRRLDPAILLRTLGLVPQNPCLFQGTIASNLRFGSPDADDDELWHALEVAQALDFVRQRPDGLQSPIAAGGANLSGGQRQRLAIARTVVRRPAVYLFDDCFSALDNATSAEVRAALAAETSSAAVVIVSQLPDQVRNADHILLLEGGRVAGSGTHADLMHGNAIYRALATGAEDVGEVTRRG